MAGQRGPEHYDEERGESEQEKAEGIIGEELRRRKWQEADLSQRAKGDLMKVKNSSGET